MNWWLVGATIVTVALTLAAIYVPGLCTVFGIEPGTFQPKELAISILLAVSAIPVFEIGKAIRRANMRKRGEVV